MHARFETTEAFFMKLGTPINNDEAITHVNFGGDQSRDEGVMGDKFSHYS